MSILKELRVYLVSLLAEVLEERIEMSVEVLIFSDLQRGPSPERFYILDEFFSGPSLLVFLLCLRLSI